MGTDWEQMSGQGGDYLVRRAEEVQKAGRLTPTAIRLVEDEAQRLRYILTDEIPRLQPSGDLTTPAIATLHALYADRLARAERVIQAARGLAGTAPPTVAAPAPPSAKASALAAPLLPLARAVTPLPAAPSQPTRSLREFFADRSILIISYAGAFLLIVATLLFELSSFTASDSTLRFLGVLVLNVIFGLAGWICFRLPSMRLVGRTYIGIAALMLPLTFIASWVFLAMQQYGLSRDLAIAIAATSCALLYGSLAVGLESKGYALLSLVAAAVAWGAVVDLSGTYRWRGAWLLLLAAPYLLLAHASAAFPRLRVVFADLADIASHVVAIGVILWALIVPAGNRDWPVLSLVSLELSAMYLAYAFVSGRLTAAREIRRYSGLAGMVLLGAFWFCFLNALGITQWAPLVFTAVMGVYIGVAGRPALRGLLIPEPAALINGAALIALAWAIVLLPISPELSTGPSWYPITITLAVIVILYVSDVALRNDDVSAVGAMVAFAAFAVAAGDALTLGSWQGPALALLALIFSLIGFRGSRLGPVGTTFARYAEWFQHGTALLCLAWTLVTISSQSESLPPAAHSYTYLAVALGALTAIYAFACWLSGRTSMQWTVAVGVSLTTVTANQALALSSSALALELLGLAVAKTLAARFYRGRMHDFFYVSAAVQAVIAGLIPIEQDWLHALILLTGGAATVFMAVDGGPPEWLYLAGAFFTYGWYWLLKVIIPPPPHPGPSTLVLIFSPLPVVYGLVAMGLARFASFRWRAPLYSWAALVAVGVGWFGAAEQQWIVFGTALVAYAVITYAAGILEQQPYAVPVGGVTLSLALLSLLHAASAPLAWYPLVFTVVAWGLYAGSFVGMKSEWLRMHRLSGLALMALVVLMSFGVTDFTMAGNPGALSALGATEALAAMLLLDSRAHANPPLDYAALVTASVGVIWIAHFFGATNVQWFVAAPGLALVSAGLLLHTDGRFTVPVRPLANAIIGVGATMLVGTTALQTFDPELSASLYTAILLSESTAALLAGIGLRSRALVLAGAAGIAIASLRAIVILIQQLPLFVVFGLLALLLLAGGAALAVLRARFADARIAMTRSWEDWS